MITFKIVKSNHDYRLLILSNQHSSTVEQHKTRSVGNSVSRPIAEMRSTPLFDAHGHARIEVVGAAREKEGGARGSRKAKRGQGVFATLLRG